MRAVLMSRSTPRWDWPMTASTVGNTRTVLLGTTTNNRRQLEKGWNTMLSAEQVKPLLLHEDRPVRDMAVDYFRDGWSQDPTLVPMILEACRRYGVQENVDGLIACGQFVLTETSLDSRLADAGRDEGHRDGLAAPSHHQPCSRRCPVCAESRLFSTCRTCPTKCWSGSTGARIFPVGRGRSCGRNSGT